MFFVRKNERAVCCVYMKVLESALRVFVCFNTVCCATCQANRVSGQLGKGHGAAVDWWSDAVGMRLSQRVRPLEEMTHP
ncbi:MAG: hypothetical protein ACC742_04060 [Thermoanaerobaculales bacterium]